MAINSYFKNLTYAREQDLIEDLTIESIKQYGHDMRYIPRTLVRDDSLFGEDTLSTFDDATELEMYIKNIEGFEGEGEFLSKFNLEVRDTITFTVARKRFDQSLTEKITTTVEVVGLRSGAVGYFDLTGYKNIRKLPAQNLSAV